MNIQYKYVLSFFDWQFAVSYILPDELFSLLSCKQVSQSLMYLTVFRESSHRYEVKGMLKGSCYYHVPSIAIPLFFT